MDLGKFAKLLDVLSKRTSAGEIAWTADPSESNRYLSKVGEHQIFVAEFERYGASDPDYYLGFIGWDGQVIDSVSDVDLKDTMGGAYPRMRALYGAARRSATGFTQIVNDVLRELGEDDDVTF